MHRYTKLAALTVALTTTAVAYSANSAENDAMAVANAKTTLTQAIAAAEQHTNGKAAKAEYEKFGGNWAYDVEVVSGAKVFDVKVDPNKGTVISSLEDKTDHGGDHNDED